MVPPHESGRLQVALRSVGVSGAVLAVAALAFGGVVPALSVAAGAALAVGNLWALGRIVASLLPEDAPSARAQSRAAWALVAALKMIALLAVAWLLMRHGFASPLPMLIGLLSLPIGIAIGSLVSDRSGALDDR